MALDAFIAKIMAEDEQGVVYSTPPEDPIQVLPPASSEVPKKSIPQTAPIKVIVPQADSEVKVIKFKLNRTPQEPEPQKETVTSEVKLPPKQVVSPPSKPVVKEPIPTEKVKISTPSEDEVLFVQSETSLDKKELWLEFYEKAKKSKKNNYLTDKMRRGRFTINSQNELIVLSDYVTSGMSVKDILNDQWL